MSARPPRLAVWLLARLLRRDERDGTLGDLEERWRERGGARVWYWNRALSLAFWLMGDVVRQLGTTVRGEARTAWRGHVRAPASSALMVVTLAVGIGGTAAIFSVIDGVLLEPLPYPDADRLVTIGHHTRGGGLPPLLPSSTATHVVYEEGSRALEALAVYTTGEVSLTGEDGPPVRVPAAWPTRSLFTVLGVAPQLGRVFSAEEDTPGGPAVVVISHGLWRTRFGGDPNVLERTVRVNGRVRAIVGVMPPGFDFPARGNAVWLPLQVDRNGLGGFISPSIGRLRPGVTAEAAQAELEKLLPRVTEVVDFITPDILRDAGLRPDVHAYVDDVVGDVRTALWVVLATMGFVLLIACANVANLLLVRAEARQQELAVRRALGAGRAQLLGLFLAESVLLAALGTAFGLLIAGIGLRLLLALAPATLPRVEGIDLDGTVLAAVLGLTAAVTIAFGVIPLLHGGDGSAASVLRHGTRGTTAGRAAWRLRRTLVVSQVALASLLLVGSGLTIRSFQRLARVDPGFSHDGVLTFRVALNVIPYATHEQVAAFHRAFLDRLAALPGVEAAGLTAQLPLIGSSSLVYMDPLAVRGRPAGENSVSHIVDMRLATPGYFEALRIPVMRGRSLGWSDTDARSGAVLITEQVARRYFPDDDPLGQEIAHGLRGVSGEREWSDVVGVVGDVRGVSLFEEPMGAVYYPLLTRPGVDMDWLGRSVTYVIRGTQDAAALMALVRRELSTLDPELPISEVRALDEVVSDARARTRFSTVLLGVAGAVGLLLGAIGLYGVVSFVTAQRTREIAVRIALGAEAASVRRMVLAHGLALTGAGLVIGLGAAFLLTRFLESLLYEVDARDPATFLLVAAALLAVGALAAWAPAARAARLDPNRALAGG